MTEELQRSLDQPRRESEFLRPICAHDDRVVRVGRACWMRPSRSTDALAECAPEFRWASNYERVPQLIATKARTVYRRRERNFLRARSEERRVGKECRSR